VAIKEFQVGPLEYVEGNYFDGDYTQPNVAKFYLQCDVDGFKGGRVATGEFFTDNYIDGTYIHSNSIKATLTVSFEVIWNARVELTNYTVESYFEDAYTRPQGSQFSIFCAVVFQEEAAAALVAQSTITSFGNKTVSVISAISAQFTQTATISHIEGADLFAFSNAAIAVQVSRIRSTNITASSVFSVATDFVVKRNADADVDALFSAIINGLRSRDTNLETQAAFSFDATAETTKVFDSALVSQCSVSITANRFRDIDSTQNSEFAQTASSNRFRESAVTVNAEFTVVAQARKIRDAHLTGTGVSAITCAAVKTPESISNQSSQFTQTSLAGKLQTVNANLPVYASVFVSRRIAELRPRNLPVPVNAYSYYDATIKKFGSHSWHPAGGTTNYDKRLSGSSGSPNNFNLSTGESFVHEGWFYFDNTTSGRVTIRINGIQIGLTATASRMEAGILNSTGSYSILSDNLFTSYNRNTWNYYAIVSNGSTVSWYINGTRYYTSTNLPTEYFNGGVIFFNPSAGVWLDEISFHTGTTLGFNPSSSSITVPTAARTNSNTYTQALWHFDNNALDDYTSPVYTFSGDTVLTSISSVFAAIGYRANFYSNVSVSSSVTAVIGKVNEINLVAFTNAAITANVNIFRGYNADCLTAATVSATAYRIKQNAADIISSATVASTPNRLRETAIALSSLATVAATANVQRSATADISANATVTAVIGRLNEINLVAFTNAAVTTTAVKTASVQSTLAFAFTQSSTAVKTTNGVSAIISANSLTALNDRFRNAGATLSTSGSTLTFANEIQGVTATLSSRFTTLHTYFVDEGYYVEDGYLEQFETRVSKTARGVASLQSVSTLTVSITASVFAALVATSQASVSATVVKTARVNVAQSGAFTVSAIGKKTLPGVSAISAVFTVFCNGVSSSEVNLVAFANASMSVTGTTTKPGNAVLSSQATFFAYTQDSLNSVGEADITSQFLINIVAVKRVSAVIVTQSVASSLSVVVKAVAVQIPLDCNFAQTATAYRIKQISSSQSVLATVSTTAIKTSRAQATINAQSTVVVNATKIVNAVIVTQAAASTLTANIRIVGLFIDCAVVTTMTASGKVTKRAVSTLSSVATFTASFTKVTLATAAITSRGSVSAIVGVRKRFTAAFTSALTFVVAIRDLRLDEIVYVIPGESWAYTIISESRIHDVYGETRIRSITGESRIRTITGESRIHIN
jgi:hypothetical protein